MNTTRFNNAHIMMKLEVIRSRGIVEEHGRESNEKLQKLRDQKNAGLKAVTLIATLNPVSQVLW